MGKPDKKENDNDSKFVKEEHESTQKFIFQKSTITKVAVIIVIAFLILIIIGLVASGTTFFEGAGE